MTAPLTTLPAPGDRFTAARKEAILTAIRRGEITEARACAVYALTADELNSWRQRLATRGQRGLKQLDLAVTRPPHSTPPAARPKARPPARRFNERFAALGEER